MRVAKFFQISKMARGAGYWEGVRCVERGDRNIAALNLVKIAGTLGVEVGDSFPIIKLFNRKL